MWELRLARQDELEKIFALYAARVRWMDAAGIHQWNDTKYLERFPLGYYEDMQKRTLLYALADEQSGTICGAAVLLAQDERWDGSLQKRAWYVHNLVTAVGASGAGKAILREAEKLAKVRGMEAIRLDCAEGNARLNAWYECRLLPMRYLHRRPVPWTSSREAALKRVLRYSGQNESQTLRIWLVTYSSIVGIEILSVPWASNSAM